MSFEVVEPGEFNFQNAIEAGQCSLSKSGKLTLRAADLEAAGIGPHYAIVMAYPDDFRVALRQVRDGEQSKSVAISVVKTGKGHDSGRRSISRMRALKRIGVTAESVAGRFELLTKGDAGAELLIVALTSVTTEDRARGRARAARPSPGGKKEVRSKGTERMQKRRRRCNAAAAVPRVCGSRHSNGCRF